MSIFQQLVFIAALGWASQAYAVSGPPKLPDFEAWSAVYSTAVQDSDGESVDPFLGALSLQNVDLAMPGAGGFDLKVVRAYNSSRVAREHRAENDPFTPKPLGWTMHFGRMLVRNRVCSGPNLYANINYMPLLEMPDGKRRLVWGVSQTGSPAMMTADNWSVICSGNGYLVTSPDGTRYDMQYGQVTGATLCPNPMYPAQECNLSMYVTTRITDKNGNFATIGYQTYVPSLPMQWRAWNEPKITQVSTNDGRSLTYTYQLMGNAEDTRKPYLTSISSNSGQTVNYGYTYVGNLDGNDVYALTSAQDPAGRQWLYQYQIPRALTDPRCNFTIDCPPQPGDLLLKKVTNPWGGVRTFTWVLIANKTKVEGVDTKTSSDGGTWKYTYARAPNVQRVTTLQSPKGQSVFYFRSELLENLGNVPPPWTSGLLLSQSDGSSQTVSQTWKGQPMGDGWASLFDMVTTWGGGPVRPVMTGRTVVRDGATYSTSFSGFDAYGYPATIAETGPSGGLRTTNLTYYRNLPKWIPGEVSDEVVPGVGSVTRTWDANGNLASETRDGVSTSFTRHATGDLWTITRPRGLVSTFTNYYRGTAQNEAHPEGVNLSRIVAARGTVSSETDAEGGTTSFLYDGINRVTSITPPRGNSTTIAYAANSVTATRGTLQQIVALDGFGRPTRVTTGGTALAHTYDSLGRKTFSSVVGFPTVGHSFQYDILDRLVRITHNADASYRTFTYTSSAGVPTLAATDERGFVTTHSYRAYGDPDRSLVMSIAAPVASASVTMARNGRGLVTSATQAGLTRQFAYDSRYYLTSTVHPEIGTTTYGRDAAGNMTSKQVGASGTSIYEYDGRNRLWRVTYPGGNPSQVTNSYWRTDRLRSVTNAIATRTFGYDTNLNLTSESLSIDGLTLAATYNYNTNDQLSSIVYPVLGRTVSFNPDVLGRPTSVVTPAGSMLNATFWPNGQVSDIAFAGGSRVTYGQSTREWLNSATVKTGDGVSRIASTLSYDVTGNVYNISDSVDATYNRTLAFDGINRLTTTTGPWGAGSVTYDGAGNVLTQVLGAETRTNAYDANNRLSTVTRNLGPSGGSTAYAVAYDVYGNATSAGSDTYTFDTASNLVSTSSGRSFAYDGSNTRVKTNYAGVTTYEFRSAHGLLLAEWRKQSGYYDSLKEHMHVAGKEFAEQRTDFLGSTVQAPSWMFLQPDISGSPLSGTWGGGVLLFKENYQPYGTQINGTAAGYTQRAFAGRTQDKSDLIYMGARYYNPLTARFLSIDPKEADPTDLHLHNRYAYANNNPYRFVDPDGRSPIDIAFFAMDAVKLGAAIYTQTGVVEAAVDLAMSAVGVLSPAPGVGEIAKATKVATKAVEGVKGVDHAVDAARAEEVARGVEKTASGRRVGDFTKAQKAEAKAENAAANGGQMACKDCNQPLANIKSEKGVPTPSNQAQVHHDPAIKNGGGQHSTPTVLCPDCHKQRHHDE